MRSTGQKQNRGDLEREEKNYTVYAVECSTAGKWYVGSTSKQPQKRLEEHQKGPYASGASWTHKHGAVQITVLKSKLTKEEALLQEQAQTVSFMSKYGVDNVRGAQWTKVELSESETVAAVEAVSHVADNCRICGSAGHYAKDCRDGKQRGSAKKRRTEKAADGSGAGAMPQSSADDEAEDDEEEVQWDEDAEVQVEDDEGDEVDGEDDEDEFENAGDEEEEEEDHNEEEEGDGDSGDDDSDDDSDDDDSDDDSGDDDSGDDDAVDDSGDEGW